MAFFQYLHQGSWDTKVIGIIGNVAKQKSFAVP